MPVKHVWLAEWADYGSSPHAVYATPEVGVAAEKARFAHPYVVVWYEVERSENVWSVTARFEAVQHYSTEHTKTLTLTRFPVVETQ